MHKRLTWNSNPFSLVNESINGRNVIRHVQERANYSKDLIPVSMWIENKSQCYLTISAVSAQTQIWSTTSFMAV